MIEVIGELLLQLLVVPLVGVAAGQDYGPREAAGFDPRHEKLSELLRFCLQSKQGLKLNVNKLNSSSVSWQYK